MMQMFFRKKQRWVSLLNFQSEEEIQKVCTKEGFTELQWSVYLLKKGYEFQKLSVSPADSYYSGHQQLGPLHEGERRQRRTTGADHCK
jgi:hypothetical protein